jgi:hypothetical protein
VNVRGECEGHECFTSVPGTLVCNLLQACWLSVLSLVCDLCSAIVLNKAVLKLSDKFVNYGMETGTTGLSKRMPCGDLYMISICR